MIRRRDHKDPIIILEAVDLVEEIAEHFWRDLRVYILDDEETRRDAAGEGEDDVNVVDSGDRLYVE